MASRDDHFVRSSPERGSRTRYNAVTGAGTAQPTGGTAPPTGGTGQDLELIRQRARRAAEFYTQTVQDNDIRGMTEGATVFTSDSSYSPQGQEVVNGSATNSGRGSDAYYPQNLRAGFIDIRNSYSEKRRTKFTAYPGRSVTKGPDTQGSGYDAHGDSGGREWGQEGQGQRGDKKLYRSNSSLELETLDYIDEDRSPLRRDYGSTSSLDVIGGTNDNFFDMLQGYRSNENPDQRAAPPPQMHEVLRGKLSDGALSSSVLRYNQKQPSYTNSTAANKASNGCVAAGPTEDDLPSGEGSQSPKTKTKLQKSKDRKQRAKTVVAETTSGGLFRKKRPNKSESESMGRSMESSSDHDLRSEERQKRQKAFVHFDCQSICFSLGQVIKRRTADSGEMGGWNRNMTTGASAASATRGLSPGNGHETADDPDDGDNNSNDLVLSCPYFRNELGGEEEKSISLNIATAQKQVQQLLGNQNLDTRTLMRPPVCNGVSVLDMSPGPHGFVPQTLFTHNGLVFEYVDQGAYYYRHFFSGMDHQNFFGIDDNLGPVAISIKREKLDEKDRETPTGKQENGGHCYQYRVIARTAELQTVRGTILEEAIPSSSRLSNTRGLPPKDLLEHVLPEVNLSSLRQATPGPKTANQLTKLDEQGIFKSYKFGVMLCKAGQCSEEDMYNNQHASPAFQEFLSLIGQEIRLKGFEKYRGGLDTKTDSTGTHALYREFHGYEIMFHVSTMLPFSPNNKQQLLRKRHIGNDIVTIVFQEPGARPFTPKSVRSQFQHVFIIVRAINPNTSNVKYSMSISRAKVVPPFGPTIPDSVLFNMSSEFAEFLLTKAINAENAVHRSNKLMAMAVRTRQEYLRDLAVNFTTNTPLDSGSKLSKFSLGSGRRKDKPKVRTFPDVFSKGAVVWNVQIEDFGQLTQVDSYLGIAAECLVVMDTTTADVIFTIPNRAVIGWTPQGNSLRLYYHRGECILLQTYTLDPDEIREIVDRLMAVTTGCETVERTMHKDSKGQLGFHVYFEGIVSNVEPQSLAWAAGLRAGSRLVEICKDATATLTHDQMLNLLRNASTVTLVYIPPNEDGTARRGVIEELRPNHSALFSPRQRSISAKDIPSIDDAHQVSAAPGSSRPPLGGTRSGGSRYGEYYRNFHQHRQDYLQSRPEYSDSSPQSTLESRHSASTLHSKQASHDSGASRSSGGHGSADRHGSRSDVRSMENLVPSGGDERRHPRDLEGLQANPNWKVYPAYNKDYVNTQGLSPRAELSFWSEGTLTASDQPEHHGDSGYHSNNSSASRPPKNSYKSSSQKSSNVGASFSVTAAHQEAEGPERPAYPQRPAEPGAGLLGPPSMTNLSQGSDLSSQSSESHNKAAVPTGSGQRSKAEENNHRDARGPSPRTGAISPAGRQRQTAFHRRSFLEASPHGSNSSSPRASRQLPGGLSEENLARLRPGARNTPPKTSPAGSNFQEDLMRLIDPDLSFAGSDTSPHKDDSYRPGRLQRAQSDESVCGAVSGRPSRHTPIDSLGDVIFTTARPAQGVVKRPPGELSAEQKLSPRALLDLPTTILHVRRTSPAVAGVRQKTVPLADGGSGLDWNNLVDAASAFETTDKNSKSSSMGVISTTPPTSTTSANSTTSTRHHYKMGLKTSKSSDLHKAGQKTGSPASQSLSEGGRSHPAGDRGVTERTPLTRSQDGAPWRSSGGSSHSSGPVDSLQRIQELEARVQELEEALDREQDARVAVESENQALREDNLRLQEESHTAAAQLRKFTEWFFNNIDHQ